MNHNIATLLRQQAKGEPVIVDGKHIDPSVICQVAAEIIEMLRADNRDLTMILLKQQESQP